MFPPELINCHNPRVWNWGHISHYTEAISLTTSQSSPFLALDLLISIWKNSYFFQRRLFSGTPNWATRSFCFQKQPPFPFHGRNVGQQQWQLKSRIKKNNSLIRIACRVASDFQFFRRMASEEEAGGGGSLPQSYSHLVTLPILCPH